MEQKEILKIINDLLSLTKNDEEYNDAWDKGYELFKLISKKQLTLTDAVGQSEQFSFEDMKDAFKAGDKFRLYLDKNATGLGHPHEKDIPSSEKIMETMSFDKWIESVNNKPKLIKKPCCDKAPEGSYYLGTTCSKCNKPFRFEIR